MLTASGSMVGGIRPTTLGLWMLIGYALSQGLRDVYLAGVFGPISFFDLVFLAFSGATLFFLRLFVGFSTERFWVADATLA